MRAVHRDLDGVPTTGRLHSRRGSDIEDAAKIIEHYEKAVERWRKLAKDVGQDEAKVQALYEKEVFSKIDINKL